MSSPAAALASALLDAGVVRAIVEDQAPDLVHLQLGRLAAAGFSDALGVSISVHMLGDLEQRGLIVQSVSLMPDHVSLVLDHTAALQLAKMLAPSTSATEPAEDPEP